MNPAENYILSQEEPFRSILLHLQSVIEQTVPEVDLKYKYKIPFYYLQGKPFCYLNKSKNFVDLGFWKAAHLSVHSEHMTAAGRKIMRSLRYTSLEDVDHTILQEVLKDACRIKDKKFWKK
ncbi:DUF1801 domain-containing protein [Eudoraea adriatica]|uniref:DUF1801 domain-containing protein n=1 Tax=Eudoraea adriatica TaxID=446681 RepID=UPI00037B4468|nr:DUF1801 domain-containing protein [Eudoraea adriatica]